MKRIAGIAFFIFTIIFVYVIHFDNIPLFDVIHSDFEKFNSYSMEEVEWIKIEYLPDEYRDDRDGIQHKMVNIEDGDLILRLEKMLDGVEVERFGDTKNKKRGGGYDLGILGKRKNPDSGKYESVRLVVFSTYNNVVEVCYDKTIAFYPIAE